MDIDDIIMWLVLILVGILLGHLTLQLVADCTGCHIPVIAV
jgi:hypothetical protein